MRKQMPAADRRHWYLTTALELEGKLKIDPNKKFVKLYKQLDL
ncbi:MAG: hypothetical protein ACRD6Q_02975 [Nitrososphaeraceae archaeon]|jgi:hypothetical protein